MLCLLSESGLLREVLSARLQGQVLWCRGYYYQRLRHTIPQGISKHHCITPRSHACSFRYKHSEVSIIIITVRNMNREIPGFYFGRNNRPMSLLSHRTIDTDTRNRSGQEKVLQDPSKSCSTCRCSILTGVCQEKTRRA